MEERKFQLAEAELFHTGSKMDYRLYEILMIFAIYSIGGYLLSCMYNSFFRKRKVIVKRGYGPYAASYGMGIVMLIFMQSFFGENLPVIFLEGVVIGTFLEIFTGEFYCFVSGTGMNFYRIYHSIIWGILAVVAVFHWNHILIAIIRYIHPWIYMVFLVVLFYNMITGYIDGICDLYEKKVRKKNGIKNI